MNSADEIVAFVEQQISGYSALDYARFKRFIALYVQWDEAFWFWDARVKALE